MPTRGEPRGAICPRLGERRRRRTAPPSMVWCERRSSGEEGRAAPVPNPTKCPVWINSEGELPPAYSTVPSRRGRPGLRSAPLHHRQRRLRSCLQDYDLKGASWLSLPSRRNRGEPGCAPPPGGGIPPFDDANLRLGAGTLNERDTAAATQGARWSKLTPRSDFSRWVLPCDHPRSFSQRPPVLTLAHQGKIGLRAPASGPANEPGGPCRGRPSKPPAHTFTPKTRSTSTADDPERTFSFGSFYGDGRGSESHDGGVSFFFQAHRRPRPASNLPGHFTQPAPSQRFMPPPG